MRFVHCHSYGCQFPLRESTTIVDPSECLAQGLGQQVGGADQAASSSTVPVNVDASCLWCGRTLPAASLVVGFCSAWHRANWEFDQQGYNAT